MARVDDRLYLLSGTCLIKWVLLPLGPVSFIVLTPFTLYFERVLVGGRDKVRISFCEVMKLA